MRVSSPANLRASISFKYAIHQNVQKIAIQETVSLAWVVREAAERYFAEATAGGKAKPGQSVRATK